MTNIDKVVKRLTVRIQSDSEEWDTVELPIREAEEILALLKHQEPIAPIVDSEGTCACGNCGETVGYYPVGCSMPYKFDIYCHECGREVKWDG